MNKKGTEKKTETTNQTKSHESFVENHLKEIGVKEGYIVLDYGCGDGNYTIPIVRILERTGQVFALDEDRAKIDQLKAKVKMLGVEERIQTIKTDGQLTIPLENETVNISFLFNVTCCIIGKNNFFNMQKLIIEIHRITKNNGKIIIGIKEGKTMKNRLDKIIPLIQDFFILEKKEKNKYFDGNKLRNGLFYYLTKKPLK
ncbi:MAG: class I SAM-dependent methyltransferase [Candidatus Hodarchaeota archaeon]